jgi:hypothetical protein
MWHVYLVPETEEVLSWAGHSLDVFHELAVSTPKAGIELVRGVELFRKGTPRIPSWSHIPKFFELLTAEEIGSFNSFSLSTLDKKEADLLKENPVKWGYHVEAPVTSMHVYLPWLEQRVHDAGVVCETRQISSIEQLTAHCDVIVNCAGYGSRELVHDDNFVAYKGQYFVLRATDSSPRTYIGDDDHPAGMAYMIPRCGEVMVGGSAEKGSDDLEFTLDWDQTIRRAGLYVPWLRGRSLCDQCRPAVAGIRPCRTAGVRLEIDKTICSVPVIHNYGHGGSGFSLSWGCAESVAALVASTV